MPGERKDHSISPQNNDQHSKYSLRARHRRSSLYRFQSKKKVVINTCSLRVRFYTQLLKMYMYFFTRVFLM